MISCGIAEQRLGDAEALAHAAGERAEVLLAHVVEVGAAQQRGHVSLRSRDCDALEDREVIEQRLGRDARIDAELLRQIAEDAADVVLLAEDVDVARA
jgi:Asp/Glu/hydantoin racemase